ncbi:transcription factor bHLH101-like isoform X2 [Spinacia oleracea]|uniref:Transcription factor bHLH101-like isoform X2 n=1 Tax=Spinacia oleracea TaxID=3562 RepID=A0ABM3R4W0_SPIOL|nr:transcription factor bHLH101-like isoform X2 [Spinacia oleracea]
MLAMSPLCLTLGWEYPLELETNQAFDNFDFDSMFVANFNSSSQAQDDCGVNQECNDHAKQSESPQDTSSTDQFDNNDNNNPLLSKKLNHNASERDRRKKINDMYSTLRALLPAHHHRKLSIPSTVARVLEYIPQLQKQVEDLTHKKEVFLSKLSVLQGNAVHEQKQNECIVSKETASCSISANKLGDKEMVIQISTFERLSISHVLLLLEKNGYLVIDVSSFQSFGGTTFYNIHLWMEGSYVVKFDELNETLMSLLQKQPMQMQMEVPIFV